MSRGFPSMTALLGVLAVAVYQNRDKLAELLGGVSGGAVRTPGAESPPQGQGTGHAEGTNDGSIGAVLTDGIRNLAVIAKKVIPGDAADGWFAVEGGVRAGCVVVVQPRLHGLGAVS